MIKNSHNLSKSYLYIANIEFISHIANIKLIIITLVIFLLVH